jgi:serine protease Do
MEGGLLLALPADAALRDRIGALGRGEAPTRPRLGLALAPPSAARRMRAAVGLEPRDGLLVREVEPGGPGAQAGLERGDLLVAAGGRPLAGVDDLFDALAAAEGELELTALRGADVRTAVAHFT